MTVGTAVFLSAVMLSAVALYGLTMDRWNWKGALENFGRMLVFLGALVLLALVVNEVMSRYEKPKHGPWEDYQQSAR